MKKIIVLAGLALILIASGYALWQKPGGETVKKRVGIVSFGGAHIEAIVGLQEGMKALGYEEGKGIEYLIRDAGGSDARAKEAAESFLQEGVDAIYSISTPVTKQVSDVVGEIPVVFNLVSDPVGAKLVQSLFSSGNNLTGCSNYVGQTGPKRLEILKEILPSLKTALVIYDPKNLFSKDAIVILRDAAKTLGVTLIEKEISSKEEVVALVETLKPGDYGAFFHLGEAKVSSVADKVIALANAAKLPAFAHEEGFAQKGMLATFGPSWRLLGRQCAGVLDKVLRGERPEAIPIQIPNEFELILNVKTARALGIEIPKDLLLRANKVIE